MIISFSSLPFMTLLDSISWKALKSFRKSPKIPQKRFPSLERLSVFRRTCWETLLKDKATPVGDMKLDFPDRSMIRESVDIEMPRLSDSKTISFDENSRFPQTPIIWLCFRTPASDPAALCSSHWALLPWQLRYSIVEGKENINGSNRPHLSPNY